MTLDKQTWQSIISDHLKKSARPLIVILGPTASGKTGLSLAVCQEFGGEVINADSRQLFCHMDIGTAKVLPSEMGGIPHHLINVLDPKEEATVGWYQSQATVMIEDILDREKIPVLVGGSMLYVSSLIDGLELGGPKDEAMRQQLESEYDMDHGETLYEKLQEIDPEAAAAIHQHNKPRVVRAIEIAMRHEKPTTTDVPYDLLIIGLGADREAVVEKINNRTQTMFAAGWVDEVQLLMDEGYTEDDPGMKACGYKEIMHYLRSGEEDFDQLTESIAAKTRQYARRQMTWWKRDDRIIWL